MCLLLTAILHFIHGMTDPVLMSLSASHVSSVRRHLPVLLVSVALFVLPVVLSYALWHHYALNTWLFAVTAFCVELCLKVRTSPGSREVLLPPCGPETEFAGFTGLQNIMENGLVLINRCDNL